MKKTKERLIKGTEILKKIAKIKLAALDDKDPSMFDALVVLTDGVNLGRKISSQLDRLMPDQLEKVNKEYLAKLEKELEHLKIVDLNKLMPLETAQFLMKATRLGWACRGLPENIVNEEKAANISE